MDSPVRVAFSALFGPPYDLDITTPSRSERLKSVNVLPHRLRRPILGEIAVLTAVTPIRPNSPLGALTKHQRPKTSGYFPTLEQIPEKILPVIRGGENIYFYHKLTFNFGVKLTSEIYIFLATMVDIFVTTCKKIRKNITSIVITKKIQLAYCRGD